MMDPAMRKASSFLVRFLGIVVILFLLWSFLSQLYLSSLVVVYNTIASTTVKFAVYGGSLAAVYHGLQPQPMILLLRGNDVFFMNLLIAPSLLLSTRLGSLRSHLVWIASVTGLIWLGHLVSLGFGSYLVIWDFVDSLGPGQSQDIALRVEDLFPRAT